MKNINKTIFNSTTISFLFFVYSELRIVFSFPAKLFFVRKSFRNCNFNVSWR